MIATNSDLEMKMRASGTPGRASVTDHLSSVNVLARLNDEVGQMSIHRKDAPAVVNRHIVAISIPGGPSRRYPPICGRYASGAL